LKLILSKIKAARFLRDIYLSGLLLFSSSLFLSSLLPEYILADDKTRQDLLNKFKNNPPKSLDSSNTGEYETVLLPYLSDFIISFDLKLNTSISEQTLTNSNIKKVEVQLNEQKWLTALKLPELIEIDQEISIEKQEQKNLKSIQSSTLKYSPKDKNSDSSLNFKERFSILSPADLSALRFLTIRQTGSADDLLWGFSPNLKRAVELTGSNRGDPVLNTIFSLDDIFFFGAKLDHLSAIAAPKEVEFLAPEIAPDIFTIEKSSNSNCSILAPSSKNLKEIALKVSISPQTVLIFDLKNSDPFSLIGRYRLFISKNSGLPLLKQEYSHLGELKKVAITNFSLVDSQYTIPVLTLALNQVGLNRKQSQLLSIRTSDGRLCEKAETEFDSKLLDPSSF
jgi:hypothetical protein